MNPEIPVYEHARALHIAQAFLAAHTPDALPADLFLMAELVQDYLSHGPDGEMVSGLVEAHLEAEFGDFDPDGTEVLDADFSDLDEDDDLDPWDAALAEHDAALAEIDNPNLTAGEINALADRVMDEIYNQIHPIVVEKLASKAEGEHFSVSAFVLTGDRDSIIRTQDALAQTVQAMTGPMH